MILIVCDKRTGEREEKAGENNKLMRLVAKSFRNEKLL